MAKTRWNFREIINRPTDTLGFIISFTVCTLLGALIIYMAVTQ